MTTAQQEHLDEIVRAASELIRTKYEIGAREHGGDLLSLNIKQLLDEAIFETVDLLIYQLSLKQKLSSLIVDDYDVRD